MTHPVTGSMLYDLVMCPHRPTMDLFGDPTTRDAPNPFVELLWDRGLVHERETIAALTTPVTDLSQYLGDEKERLTTEAIERRDPLIYSGRVKADDLLGEPDLLRFANGCYVAGDIKSGSAEEGGHDDEGRLKKHYAMQLALYTDILERKNLSDGARCGFIWDKDRQEVPYDLTVAQGVRNTKSFWDDYVDFLDLARSIVRGNAGTTAAYAAPCKLCHWYSACLRQLEQTRDLTLLPELGRSRRNSLENTFRTIPEFAATNPTQFIQGKKTAFSRIGPDVLLKLHKRAQLAMTPENGAYAKEAINLPRANLEVFFDIETDPMREICYLHGFVERRHGDNGTMIYRQFFAQGTTEDAEHACFADAWEYVRTLPADCKIYYYSKYERTIWRGLRERYPDVCNEAELENFFHPDHAIDLYFDVVLKKTEWPTIDFSIKTLARYLGFEWRDTNPSGAASIEWYSRWVDSGTPEIRQRILDYNEDDCKAMAVLLDGIRGLSVLDG